MGTYTYDANGNMTSDSRDGLHLGYNFLNLVREVRSGSATGAVKARYTWSSDGAKLRVRAGTAGSNPAASEGFDYLGSLTYTSSATGAFDEWNKVTGLKGRYEYIYNEGQANGKLDFTAVKYKGIGAVYSDVDQSLFLVGGIAHNYKNFGNFLFGAAGRALGLSLFELQMGHTSWYF